MKLRVDLYDGVCDPVKFLLCLDASVRYSFNARLEIVMLIQKTRKLEYGERSLQNVVGFDEIPEDTAVMCTTTTTGSACGGLALLVCRFL